MLNASNNNNSRELHNLHTFFSWIKELVILFNIYIPTKKQIKNKIEWKIYEIMPPADLFVRASFPIYLIFVLHHLSYYYTMYIKQKYVYMYSNIKMVLRLLFDTWANRKNYFFKKIVVVILIWLYVAKRNFLTILSCFTDQAQAP